MPPAINGAISIVWSDRYAAAEWANLLVAEADKALRDRAIAEQNRSLEYLKAEAAQTFSVEIGTAISKLTETELKNAMVARTRDAYAFKVVDPAVAADRKHRDSPNKPLIVAMGAGLGFVVGVIVAAVRRRRADPR
jgi:LPS O-antigen subunit length determinant protein (WzzB/FepE family)